jgi:hypothetical protein
MPPWITSRKVYEQDLKQDFLTFATVLIAKCLSEVTRHSLRQCPSARAILSSVLVLPHRKFEVSTNRISLRL